MSVTDAPAPFDVFFAAGSRWMRTLRLRRGGRGRVTREQFIARKKAAVEELLR